MKLTKEEEKILAKLFQKYKWIALFGQSPSDSLVLFKGTLLIDCKYFNATLSIKENNISIMAIAAVREEDGTIKQDSNGKPQMMVIT